MFPHWFSAKREIVTNLTIKVEINIILMMWDCFILLAVGEQSACDFAALDNQEGYLRG
jgi:hypothetical protein